MNVSAMARRLKGKNYTVKRVNEDGSYSTADGSFQPGDSTILSIMGSVQPMTADELLSIPEGDRTRERFRFYSYPGLKNNETAALRRSDVVVIEGEDFLVEKIEHWPGHTKAIVARVNTNAN